MLDSVSCPVEAAEPLDRNALLDPVGVFGSVTAPSWEPPEVPYSASFTGMATWVSFVEPVPTWYTTTSPPVNENDAAPAMAAGRPATMATAAARPTSKVRAVRRTGLPAFAVVISAGWLFWDGDMRLRPLLVV